MENIADTLLIHFKHSKPVEVGDFTRSLNGFCGLYTSFAEKNGYVGSGPKLYVSKIKEGSIDIFLQSVTPAVIPFLENATLIIKFVELLKSVYDYYAKGKGEKPSLTQQDCRNYKDAMAVSAHDNNGETSVTSIDVNGNVFNGCTFNFTDGNTLQNQLSGEIKSMQENTEALSLNRVLMTIYQARSNMDTNKGNKAIIDGYNGNKPLALLFESDKLKEDILVTDINPPTKGFQVDVEMQKANGKVVAYKVLALHDTIELE